MKMRLPPLIICWDVQAPDQDWYESCFIPNFLSRIQAAGWIGCVESLKLGFHGTEEGQVPTHEAAEVGEVIWSQIAETEDPTVMASGSEPASWSIYISLHYSFEAGVRYPIDNILLLRLDASHIEATGGAGALHSVFKSVHHADDTFRAGIHLEHLRTKILRKSPPITYGLSSPFWANYFGPCLARCIPPEALISVDGTESELTAEGGLFVFLGQTLDDMDSPEVEERRKVLNQTLRTLEWQSPSKA